MSDCKEVFIIQDLLSRYWWKVALIKAIGGRPMIYLDFAFTDKVSGKAVNYYQDRLGRCWMANGKWSAFRVKTEHMPHLTNPQSSRRA